MKNNLTALMCLFVKSYHKRNSNIILYNDSYSSEIINDTEYDLVLNSLLQGKDFFKVNDNVDKVKIIINSFLAPSILARSIISENIIKNNINEYEQCLILGSGYDCISLKYQNDLSFYELDKDYMIDDKLNRINHLNINNNVTYIKTNFNDNWINDLLKTKYDSNKKTIVLLLGVVYYLSKETFNNLLSELSKVLTKDSIIVFDFQNNNESNNINESLANKANEKMLSKYKIEEMNSLIKNNNYSVANLYDSEYVNEELFAPYNETNNEKLIAKNDVSFCVIKTN